MVYGDQVRLKFVVRVHDLAPPVSDCVVDTPSLVPYSPLLISNLDDRLELEEGHARDGSEERRNGRVSDDEDRGLRLASEDLAGDVVRPPEMAQAHAILAVHQDAHTEVLESPSLGFGRTLEFARALYRLLHVADPSLSPQTASGLEAHLDLKSSLPPQSGLWLATDCLRSTPVSYVSLQFCICPT